MVRLKKTAQLQAKLETLVKQGDGGLAQLLPLEVLDAIQGHLDQQPAQAWVEHTLLVKVSRWNKSSEAPKDEYTLKQLIRGTEVYIDLPIVKERSPELESILAPILLAQEQAQYTALISSSSSLSNNPLLLDPYDPRSSSSTQNWEFSSASRPVLSVKQEWEAVRRELSAVANVVASMAAVATSLWWAAGNAKLVEKVLLSLFGALAIAAVEAFLYIRFFTKTRAIPKKPNPGNRLAKQLVPSRLDNRS